jgi:hypothetical protein
MKKLTFIKGTVSGDDLIFILKKIILIFFCILQPLLTKKQIL